MPLSLLPIYRSAAVGGEVICQQRCRQILFTSGHLGLEHLDHVVEVAGATDLAQHVVELTLGHELADVVEGSSEVVLRDGAIL